jgi:hypothetical protein
VDRTADNIAFALFVGIPLAAVSWAATKVLAYVLGRPAAWIVGGAAILAWPIYYVSMTAANPYFLDGLALLAFTTPAMAVGWLVALARLSRR